MYVLLYTVYSMYSYFLSKKLDYVLRVETEANQNLEVQM